jgi:hypothetical protein
MKLSSPGMSFGFATAAAITLARFIGTLIKINCVTRAFVRITAAPTTGMSPSRELSVGRFNDAEIGGPGTFTWPDIRALKILRFLLGSRLAVCGWRAMSDSAPPAAWVG